MFTKRFVSLYFSSTDLRVVQLDTKSNKVKVATTIPLPDGIVTNRMVVDEKALSILLQRLWEKLKIKEKSVGLVIPEFSTFTKTLQFPRVDKSEVGEAVSWQSQEFLPWGEEDTILDWKVIGSTKKSYEVLFVAVRREVLLGYVNAVSAAGLFPIVVETPSLSLVRLSNSGDVGKLLFYGGNNSGIFILTKGDRIYGSSVVYSSNLDNLVSTAKKMAAHYNKVSIDVIEMGGPTAEGEFASKLAEVFGKKTTVLGTGFKGVPKEHVNKYLIPLSLQLKDPADPSDEKTINLLPKKWVKKYEFRKLQLQIWSLTLLVSYIVWLTFFATLTMYVYMGQQIVSLQAKNAQFRSTNPEKVLAVEKVQSVNAKVDKILSISNVTIYPQVILNSIYRVRPDTVTINHYRVNLETGDIVVAGIAKDRQTFIAFKQAIEGVEQFSLVVSPIASLEVNRDVPYTMSFSYLPISSKSQ